MGGVREASRPSEPGRRAPRVGQRRSRLHMAQLAEFRCHQQYAGPQPCGRRVIRSGRLLGKGRRIEIGQWPARWVRHAAQQFQVCGQAFPRGHVRFHRLLLCRG